MLDNEEVDHEPLSTVVVSKQNVQPEVQPSTSSAIGQAQGRRISTRTRRVTFQNSPTVLTRKQAKNQKEK